MADGIIPWRRAEAYNARWAKRYPDSRLYSESEKAIHGVWSPGNDYRNKSAMYGAYPRGYLERILALFPDAERILHLFSGSLTAEQVEKAWKEAWPIPVKDPPVQIRVDDGAHPAAKAALPDVIEDAEDLSEGLKGYHYRGAPLGPIDLVLADPPYDKADQLRYWLESGGTKETFVPLRKRAVLAEVAKVLRPGGWLVWLDTSRPMYSKTTWIHRGVIAIYRSTGHRIRGAWLLERAP